MVSSRMAPATDEVGAARVEPGDGQPLLEVERDDLLAHAANLLRRDAQVAQLRRRRAARRGRRDGAEAEDRSRRADDAIEPAADDLLAVAVDRRRERASTSFRSSRSESGSAVHEALGQPDDAELEAARELTRRARCRA